MKVESKIAALAAVSLATAGVSSARANLLLAPGFEPAPAANPAPSAATADQLIPGSIAPSVPAQQNPWFYGRTDGTKTSANAYYSSTLPSASGSSNRINTVPTGGTAQGFTANDGNQYAYAYTTGQAAGQVTYVAQGVTGAAIIPGDTYQALAYFFVKNNTTGTAADGDRLQGTGFDSLRLVFLDSTGAIISSADSVAHVDATSQANKWLPISFSAVAPALTASIVFENLATRGTGGVMFVDTAALDDVTGTPEPASLGLAAVGAGALLRRRRR